MTDSEISYLLPGNPELVDVELKYSADGKSYTFIAKASPSAVIEDIKYGEIHSDYYIDPVGYYKISHDRTIKLSNIEEWKIRYKEEIEMSDTVVTTRKVLVNDFTFESIAAARKKAGAPKSSTFETSTHDTSSLVREKSVTFTWDELLAV